MALTADHKVTFESRVKIGDKIAIDCNRGLISGTLDEVLVDGIVVSWKSIGVVRVGSTLQEDIVSNECFIPFDEIITYSVSR